MPYPQHPLGLGVLPVSYALGLGMALSSYPRFA
jgi:hypothetical protein